MTITMPAVNATMMDIPAGPMALPACPEWCEGVADLHEIHHFDGAIFREHYRNAAEYQVFRPEINAVEPGGGAVHHMPAHTVRVRVHLFRLECIAGPGESEDLTSAPTPKDGIRVFVYDGDREWEVPMSIQEIELLDSAASLLEMFGKGGPR